MAKKRESAELVAPDPFLETANRYVSWIERHGKPILLGAGALLLVTFASIFLQAQQKRSASMVSTDLSKAIEAYQEATDPSKIMTATTSEALTKDIPGAREKFDALIKDHGNSEAGRLAHLYAGDLERRMQNHAAAEQHFRAYVDGSKAQDQLLFLALEGVGYALEEQGKLDEALAAFERITKLEGNFYKDYAHKHIGRIRELKGEKDLAKAEYKKILDEFPDSKLRDFAERRVQALE